MFFEAKDGRSYPINRIVSVLPTRDGKTRVELTGGAVVEGRAECLAELNRRPACAFVAQVGTFVVSLDDATGEVSTTPVLGWCLALDGKTYPVTADGVNGGSGDALAIRTPDGRVAQPLAGAWDNLDAWAASRGEPRAA